MATLTLATEAGLILDTEASVDLRAEQLTTVSIAVLNVGTAATLPYTTVEALTWTLAPAPSDGSDLIITFAFINVGALSANTPSIADNQSGNSYTLIKQQTDLNGDGTQGALNSVIWRAKNINVAAPFIVTITTVAGRQSSTANHLEVIGLDQTTTSDQTGGYTSGASVVSTETVTAGGANSAANEFVVAVTSCYNKSNAVNVLPDPAASGYASIMYGENAANGTATLVQCYEASYKIVTGIETSAAMWGGLAPNPLATAVIATFKGVGIPANCALTDWYTH